MSDSRRRDDWFETDDDAGGDWRDETLPAGLGEPGKPGGEARSRGGPFDGRRPAAAGHVLLAMLIGLALAAFLNSAHLERTAKGLPLGLRRSVAVIAVTPVRFVSHALLLDRPAQLAMNALGRKDFSEEDLGTGLADLGDPGASDGGLRKPTRKDPLRVWVGGDSMTQVFGQALVDDMRRTRVMNATLDYRISTGLSRPDYFDWLKHLDYQMPALQPDAVVIMFGANDGQSVEYQGKVLKFGTPAWLRLYRERVGEAMDIALRDGSTRVYWVGQPIVRSPEFSKVLATMNDVYRAEAAKRPLVTYIDSWPLFAGKDGGYAAYLRDDQGHLQLMRQADGVHLSLAGGDRLAGLILDRVKTDYKLVKSAP